MKNIYRGSTIPVDDLATFLRSFCCERNSIEKQLENAWNTTENQRACRLFKLPEENIALQSIWTVSGWNYRIVSAPFPNAILFRFAHRFFFSSFI